MNVKRSKRGGVSFGPLVASLIASGVALSAVLSGCAPDAETLNNACGNEKISGLEEIAKSGRFLMKTRRTGVQEAGRAEIASIVAAMASGDTKVEPVVDGLYSVTADDAGEAADIAARLEENPDIEYVEPDHVLTELVTFNDPSASKQWAHGVVQSAKAWDIGTGSHDIVVGVIDSGIAYTHSDLKDNMWKNPGEVAGNGKDDDGNGYVDDIYGWDFYANDNSPTTDSGSSHHGSHVAGTIGGTGGNGIGITGHAPKVRLAALKFLGGTSGSGLTSNAIKAIDYAIKKGFRVLNNSWGGSSYNSSLYAAIGRAKAAGILFVAAAGNAGGNYAIYPGGYNWDNIISVASTTSTDGLSSFSNYHSSTVDVGAPGSSIYSTLNASLYGYKSGTSMATPLVSGVAAMMFALRPNATYAQVKSAIMTTVDKKPALLNKVASDGRINAYKAMQAIAALPGSGGGTTTPPTGGTTDPGTDGGGGNTDPLPQPGTACDLS